MEDLLQKKEHMSKLYDFYKNLLTDKQREYFESYYFDDMSFGEIAESSNVSRNAVFTCLKSTCAILEEYETKLNLVNKNKKIESLISKYNNSDCKDVLDIIKELKEME